MNFLRLQDWKLNLLDFVLLSESIFLIMMTHFHDLQKTMGLIGLGVLGMSLILRVMVIRYRWTLLGQVVTIFTLTAWLAFFDRSYVSAVCGLILALLVSSVIVGEYTNWNFSKSVRYILARSIRLEALLYLLFLVVIVVVPQLASLKKTDFSSVGFQGEMRPSLARNVRNSDQLAFRVFFDQEFQKKLPFEELYWRGVSLSKSDGLDWFPDHSLLYDSFRSDLSAADKVPLYEVLLERDISGQNLFILSSHLSDIAFDPTIEVTNNISSDYRLSPRSPPTFSYRVYERQKNVADAFHNEEIKERVRREGPRIKASDRFDRLVLELKRSSDLNQKLERIKKFFYDGGFSYSLNLKQPSKGLEDFLFNSRVGFCEHFAGATASLLRESGESVRVVLGYQGGQWNSIGSYLLLRQKDAHAWVEVFDRSSGQWRRVDPTSWIDSDVSPRVRFPNASVTDLESSMFELRDLAKLYIASFSRFVKVESMENAVQGVFDLSEALNRRKGTAAIVIILVMACFLVIWLFRAFRRTPVYIREFKKLERSLVSVNSDFKKHKAEGYQEWLERCAKDLPTSEGLKLLVNGERLSQQAFRSTSG